MEAIASSLDYKTLAVILAATCFFQAFGLGYVWRIHRKFMPARQWAIGSFCVAIGIFLVVLYPEEASAPAFVKIFRNLIISWGSLVFAFGLLRTCAHPIPWRMVALIALFIIAGTLWYTLWTPSTFGRIAVVTAALVAEEIYVGIVTLRVQRGPLKGTQRIIGLLLLLHASALVWRVIVGSQTTFQSSFQHAPGQLLFFLGSIALAFLLTLLVSVLTSQHMNALLSATLDNLNQGVAMFDAEQKLIICNERYGQLYDLDPAYLEPGTKVQTIINQRIKKGIFSGPNPEAYFRERTAAVELSSSSLHHLNDGRSIAVSRRPMQGGGWVTTHQDMTPLRHIELQLAHMAHHDALTGLANRLLFRERMQEALARLSASDEKFCLILLDLDRFKIVNDTMGHPVGDRLLQTVAARLQACTLSTDTVARLGGDEFAIVRTDIAAGRAGIVELVERLLAAIARPYEIDDRIVTIGASIGLALAPQDAGETDHLMQKADLALYRSKSEGRNGYCFYASDMDAQGQTRLAVERALRHADMGADFAVSYRPFVDGQSERPCSAAAILQWRGTEAGVIQPDEIVDLAEKLGLGARLGEWTLQQACVEAVNWPEHVTLAVDLSPSLFAADSVTRVVGKALEDSGLPPARLVLRVSEACLAANPSHGHDILRDLKMRGSAIALVDFGAGPYSLKQLFAFSYDHIAINEVIVADIASNANAGKIVSSFAGFAKSLGSTTIAEGIIHAEQYELLKTMGCEQFGGALFGPCRSAAELNALSRDTKVA